MKFGVVFEHDADRAMKELVTLQEALMDDGSDQSAGGISLVDQRNIDDSLYSSLLNRTTGDTHNGNHQQCSSFILELSKCSPKVTSRADGVRFVCT